MALSKTKLPVDTGTFDEFKDWMETNQHLLQIFEILLHK
jgi:hypothetical protein